jgi:predicted dehydrogenase
VGTKPFRAAFIGLTGIVSAPVGTGLGGGRGVQPYSHAAAVDRLPLDVDLVAVCDLSQPLIDQFTERWGQRWPNLRSYTDFRQMLDQEQIDILMVATPDDKHAFIVVEAAGRGVPAILCEKPLATTLADADAMIAAVEQSGTLLSIEHTRRWDPFFHRAKELIDAGVIGEVKTVVSTLHGDRAMLFRNGTHAIDLLCYYAGSTPTHVWANLEDGFDGFTEYRGDGGHDPSSEPGATGYIRFENGVRGIYNGTKGSLANAEWDIAGSAGRIRISATTAELYTVDGTSGEVVQRAYPAAMIMTGGIQGAWEELIGVLANGGTNADLRSNAYEARKTVQLLTGMLTSHDQGSCLIAL